jgi:DNA-binding NarL/FixJ family response regulator
MRAITVSTLNLRTILPFPPSPQSVDSRRERRQPRLGAHVSRSPAEDVEGQPSPPVRVLIVDDDEPWRRWIYSELGNRRQFQIVGEASDGLEAVRKAGELKPDIILLDISLPSLNGFEVANRIARISPGSKMIFLTTESDLELVQQALSSGATGYVLKFDANKELLPAIAAVIQGSRFLSKRLATKS